VVKNFDVSILMSVAIGPIWEGGNLVGRLLGFEPTVPKLKLMIY
jgi:hypothetical protein